MLLASMKQLLLFALILSVVASAKVQEIPKLSFAEIRSTPFGATILSTIQVNIAAGHDASPIVELVESIIIQLNEVQQQADAKNSTDKVRCDLNIAQFSRQIKETTQTIAILEENINQNQYHLKRDSDSLNEASDDYDNTTDSIHSGNSERNASQDRQTQSVAEIEAAITLIDEATKLIQHLSHGVSFAQVQAKYDKVLVNFSEKTAKHSVLFKPVIAALSQLASTHELETAQKILNLLSNLRAALEDQKQDELRSELVSAELWQKLLQQLQNNKQKSAELKIQYGGSVTGLDQLLQQQQISLNSNKNSLDNFEFQLEEEVELCARQSQDYLQESAENQKETNLLLELISSLKGNFQSLLETFL